jgi:hypothetical protein
MILDFAECGITSSTGFTRIRDAEVRAVKELRHLERYLDPNIA